ncbi:MAG: hypothetical protein MZV65_01560 [Chromatiales bacterium]|nr:hypothetical protein [Chromatiales bacterium]
MAVVTDAHEGERLGHYPLQDGDVVVVDRGYNQAPDVDRPVRRSRRRPGGAL